MKEYLKAINKLAMQCVVKVLKVDLNTGIYKNVYLNKGEHRSLSPYLDDWIKESCSKELIREDYSEAFGTIFLVSNIKKTLQYSKYIHYKFLRKPNEFCDEYRASVITAIPVDDDKNECYLIVYDINNC